MYNNTTKVYKSPPMKWKAQNIYIHNVINSGNGWVVGSKYDI